MTDFSECLKLHNLTTDDVDQSLSQEVQSSNGTVSNTDNSSMTCTQIQSFLEEFDLSCQNVTEYNRRSTILGTRNGMNVLGIIIFIIAFGVVLGQLGPEAKKVVATIGVLNEAIMKLISIVMW